MAHRSGTLEYHSCAVQRVIGIMRQNLGAPLDLDAMANVACMSRYHFLRVFEEITSISPARFQAALRIERAKHLLLETSLSITSVCYEVDYNSLGTFTRLFTDFVGLAPNAFRRLHQDLSERPIEDLITSYLNRKFPGRMKRILQGSVGAPASFHGIIFLGLFSSPIPRYHPINGALLLHQGRFELAVGRNNESAWLLAAGFLKSSPSSAYFLPSHDDLLVASSPISLETSETAVQRHYNLNLRPLTPFDPPILTALPVLLQS